MRGGGHILGGGAAPRLIELKYNMDEVKSFSQVSPLVVSTLGLLVLGEMVLPLS